MNISETLLFCTIKNVKVVAVEYRTVRGIYWPEIRGECALLPDIA